MKSKLFAALALVGLVSASSAATVNIVRSGQGTGIQAQTSAGVNLTAGGYYVAVGNFTTVPTITDNASFQAAVNAFNIFGTFTSPISGGTVGLVVGAVTATNTDFNSAPLWLLVGNGATKETSTEFAIIGGTPGWTFAANLGVAGGTNYTLGNAENIAPLTGAGTEIDNATGFDVIQLRPLVPEPSVALLGALGLLGLVRRRR